jgi:hypothetical protein
MFKIKKINNLNKSIFRKIKETCKESNKNPLEKKIKNIYIKIVYMVIVIVQSDYVTFYILIQSLNLV